MMDVSNPESVRKAYEFVTSKLPAGKGLWGVLNNAGIGGRAGRCEWLSIKDYQQVLDVNLLGMINVTMTFLPLIKKSRGRIVNMSSAAGRFAVDSFIPYCVSKYGIEAFTDGLRRSLRPYNCHAILIEPGFYKTNLTTQANIFAAVEQAWTNSSPQIKEEFGEEYFKSVGVKIADVYNILGSSQLTDVIDAYEHALLGRYPRARYVPDFYAQLLVSVIQALPEWFSDGLMGLLDRGKPVPAILRKTTRQ
jgi:NAD(P)-dependent dehydrogenase (short-subunit alcohol dehydrogenase family)